jgi:hypothetical protein
VPSAGGDGSEQPVGEEGTTSSVNVKISRGQTSLSSTGGDGSGQAPLRMLDLFDSGLSTSDGEAVVLVPRQKLPRNSPPPKAVPKSSDAPTVKDTSAWSFSLHFL